MKRFIYLFAAAALILGGSSCAKQADKTAEATETSDDKQFEEDIEAGADPQTAEAASNLVELKGDDLSQLTPVEGQVLAIDFGATWCGPCQKFHPTFDEAAAKYSNVKFVYVDVDENPGAAEKYGVEAVPTIIVVNTKGNEARYTGIDELLPSDKFFAIIENASK